MLAGHETALQITLSTKFICFVVQKRKKNTGFELDIHTHVYARPHEVCTGLRQRTEVSGAGIEAAVVLTVGGGVCMACTRQRPLAKASYMYRGY